MLAKSDQPSNCGIRDGVVSFAAQSKKARMSGNEVARTVSVFRLVFIAFLLQRLISSRLAQCGPAVAMEDGKPKFGKVDYTNQSLKASSGKLHKIYQRVSKDGAEPPLIKGPETVVFDNQGTMYVLTEEAKLIELTDFHHEPTEDSKSVPIMTAKATEVAELGGGRPLGGKFAKDGTLYVADAILGLLRVRFPRGRRPVVEIVANRVKVDGKWSRLLFADDVDIGPKTGHVYFTDASDIAPLRIGTRTWDTLGASKLDFMRGKRSGRLLRYDPTTEEVEVLASDMAFANGVAVDREESFVMVSETFRVREVKYHLKGAKRGELEAMVERLPGIPDGADCSFDTGMCYAPLVTKEPPIVKLLFMLPSFVNVHVRTFLMMLPGWLQPKPVPYGCFVEINPGGTDGPPMITRIIQDPDGADIGMVTGVTEHKGKLYLGSLENDFVGVYDLK